jgi:hypothetical protein
MGRWGRATKPRCFRPESCHTKVDREVRKQNEDGGAATTQRSGTYKSYTSSALASAM